MDERIQKILARAGYGSRRECEKYLSAGRVKVNGRQAVLGEKADAANDRIEVDGQVLPASEALVYVAVYKPRNVLSTVSSPDPRRTVVDLVEVPERIYPVGRLDVDSEGLMLLTNDGELANQLTHPRYGHEKEYRVLVASRPDEEQLATWRRGVVLEDNYRTQPVRIWTESTSGKGAWLGIVMHEGRKRQIRETGGRLGLPVVKIIRVRIGSLLLGSLKPGEWRRLTASEVTELRNAPTSPIEPHRTSKGGQPVKVQPWHAKAAAPVKKPYKSTQPGQADKTKSSYKPKSSGSAHSSQGKQGYGKPSNRPPSSKQTTQKSNYGQPGSRPDKSRPPKP